MMSTPTVDITQRTRQGHIPTRVLLGVLQRTGMDCMTWRGMFLSGVGIGMVPMAAGRKLIRQVQRRARAVSFAAAVGGSATRTAAGCRTGSAATRPAATATPGSGASAGRSLMSLSYSNSKRERGKQGVEGRNSGALREGLRVEFENNEGVEGAERIFF